MQFGLNYGINNKEGKPPKEEVYKILNFAAEKGISTLDTASAYGDAQQVLGQYDKDVGVHFKVNSKFNQAGVPLKKQLNDTLLQLNRTSIQVYFYHSFEQFRNYPSVLNELIQLKEKKLISQIGLSVYENDEFLQAIDTPQIDVIQLPFNLLDNNSQRGKLITLAKDRGKKLQVRSVFLQGLFFRPLEGIPIQLQSLLPYLKKIRELSAKYNVSLESMSLLYVVQQKNIDEVIIGVDNKKQLVTNLEILNHRLPEELLKEIDQINVKGVSLLYPQNW